MPQAKSLSTNQEAGLRAKQIKATIRKLKPGQTHLNPVTLAQQGLQDLVTKLNNG